MMFTSFPNRSPLLTMVSSMYGSAMLTKKVVANVTKSKTYFEEAECPSCYGVGFACASGSDPALLSG